GALSSTTGPFCRVEDQTPPGEAPANTAAAAAHPYSIVGTTDAALHPLYDAYWQERAVENKADRIRVPALFWTGWDDVYPRGETMNYGAAGSDDKALVVGPWGHIGGTGDAPYEFLMQDALRWFEVYVRARPVTHRSRRAGLPPVRLFDIDRTSQRTFDG